MSSPLSIYKSVVKQLGVSDEHNLPVVGKASYLATQIDEQKHVLNRLLFDLSTATFHLNNAKDDTTKEAYEKQASTYKADIRQIHASLKFNLELLGELRAESPELQVQA